MARTKRLDIINNLPRGGAISIAEKLGCDKSYVSAVLNGNKNLNSHKAKMILAHAEVMAAMSIWNSRFCSDPDIDPLSIEIKSVLTKIR